MKKRRTASAATSGPMVKRSPIGTMTTSGGWISAISAHVAENVRVAHVIDGRLAGRLDDDAVGVADGQLTPISTSAGGMVGPHEGDREPALVRRAAGVHGIEAVRPLRARATAQVVVRDDLGAGLLRRWRGCRRHGRHGRA